MLRLEHIHPMVVHFPIVLALLALAFDLWWLVRRKATPTPLIVANRALEITATFAMPERNRPATQSATSRNTLAAPVACRKDPKIRNSATVVVKISIGVPKMPLPPPAR